MTRGDQFGSDYHVREYKPTSFHDVSEYNPSGTEYKYQYKDPMKPPEFKPVKFEPPVQEKFEYKPYKPSHVGMYGDKERPPKKPSPRVAKPKPGITQKKNTAKKLKTFKCYEDASGPDIKIKNSGPDLPIREYTYQDPYLLRKPDVEKPMPDPYNPTFRYEDRKLMTPKKQADYKLTEQNNLGMRHFQGGFVDDTIMRKRSDSRARTELVMVPKTPKKKSKAAVQPAAKKPKTPVKTKSPPPVVAAAPPPVAKKKFVNSSTQHITPGNKSSQTQTQAASLKTSGTQYEKTQSKHMNIQTDTPQQLPPVAVGGAVMALPKNKVPSKSKSVQASEPEKKVAVAGTQYTGPQTKQATMQTSPVMFATQTSRHAYSPEVARTEPVLTRQMSPEPMVYRRSPSPQAAPRVDTPQRQPESRWSPPPVVLVRQDTPPIRDTKHRVNTPTRIETPPHFKTPPPLESPDHIETPTWQSPIYHLTPEPRERVVSPPQTFASIPAQKPSSEPSVYQPAKTASVRDQSYSRPVPPVRLPYFEPRRQETPPPHPSHSSGRGFQSNLPKNLGRLPPEVNACIEAYDNAHTDLIRRSGESLPSVKRTMRFA